MWNYDYDTHTNTAVKIYSDLVNLDKSIEKNEGWDHSKIKDFLKEFNNKSQFITKSERSYLSAFLNKVITKYNEKNPHHPYLDAQIGKLSNLYATTLAKGATSEVNNRFLQTLNMKTFANLVGDVFLTKMQTSEGTNLEGLNQIESIKFFINSLDYVLSSHTEDFTKEESEKLFFLKDKLQEAIFWGKKIEDCRFTAQHSKINQFKQLKQELASKIESLKVNETIIIPLGWNDKNGKGHAIFLECRRTPTNLQVIVYNTGDGAEYHYSKFSNYKLYNNTICEYAVSNQEIPNFLNQTLPNLLELKILSPVDNELHYTNEFSADDFYYHLQEYSLVERHTHLMRTQLSGTCTIKVQLALLGFTTSKDTQSKFKRLWIYTCLDILSQNIDEIDADYLRIISRIIPQLFRKLHKEIKELNKIPEKKQKEINHLFKLEEEFKKHYKHSFTERPPLTFTFDQLTSLTKEIHDQIAPSEQDSDREAFLDTPDSPIGTSIYTPEGSPSHESWANSEIAGHSAFNDFKNYFGRNVAELEPKMIFSLIMDLNQELDSPTVSFFQYKECLLLATMDFFVQLVQLIINRNQFKDALFNSLKELNEADCLSLMQSIAQINYKSNENIPASSELITQQNLFQYSCFLLCREIAILIDEIQGNKENGAIANYNFSLTEMSLIKKGYFLPFYFSKDQENHYNNILDYFLKIQKSNKKNLVDLSHHSIELKNLSGDELYVSYYVEKKLDWKLADAYIKNEELKIDSDTARKRWLYCFGLPKHFKILRKIYLLTQASFLGHHISSHSTIINRVKLSPNFASWGSDILLTPSITKGDVPEAQIPPENNLMCSDKANEREFAFHALSEGLQFGALLDYYKANPILLSITENQHTFAYIVFQAFRLSSALANFPDLKKDIIQFFDELLFYYQVQKPIITMEKKTQTTVFLLQMKQRMFQYVLDEKNDNEDFLRSMRQQIKDTLDHPNFQDPHIKFQLQLCFVESFLLYKKIDEKLAIELLSLFLEINFKLLNSPPDHDIPHSQDRNHIYSYGSLCYGSMQAIQKHQTEISKMLDNPFNKNKILDGALEKYGIAAGGDWIRISYSVYEKKIKDNTYTILPLFNAKLVDGEDLDQDAQNNIFSQHTYIDLFGHYRMPLKAIDQGTYEGQDLMGNFYRFQIKSYDLDVLRKIDTHWYKKTNESLPVPISYEEALWVEMESEAPSSYIINQKTNVIVLKINPNGSICPSWDLDHCYQLFNVNHVSFFLGFSHTPFLLQSLTHFEQQFIHLMTAKDEDNESLLFEKKGDKWIWSKEPQFFIAEKQIIYGLDEIKEFILLENESGKQEALIKSDENFNSQFIRLEIVENQLITQSSTEKNLYLAYQTFLHAQYPRDYLQVFTYLEASVEFRSYTKRELTLFSLIIGKNEFSFLDNRNETKISLNHDPDAFALRLYAAWLIFDNQKRYPSKINDKNQHLTYSQSFTNPWAGIENIRIGYLQRKKHVQSVLRLEKLISSNDLLEWGLFEVKLGFDKEEEMSLDGFIDNVPPKLEKTWHSDSLPTFRTRIGKKFKDYFYPLYHLALSEKNDDRKLIKEILLSSYLENSSIGSHQFYKLLTWAAYLSKEKSDARNLLAKDIIKSYESLSLKYDYFQHEKFKKQLRKLAKAIHIQLRKNLPVQEQNSIYATERVLPSMPHKKDFHYHPSLNFHRFNQLYQMCFKEMIPTLPDELLFASTTENEEFLKQTISELNDDHWEGCKRNIQEQQIHCKIINSDSQVNPQDQVIHYLKSQQEILASEHQHDVRDLEKLKKLILEKVNAPLLETKKALKVHGKRKQLFTLDDCLWLFLQGDLNKFNKILNTKNKEISLDLYASIWKYLEISSKSFHLNNIIQAIQKLNSQNAFQQLPVIANLLKKEYKIADSKNPAALLVFENQLKLSLFEHQVNGINEMLPDPKDPFRYPDVFLHKIQGAGKTLIFGHLMAYLKADGYHLSLHVTPTYQFATGIYDMKKHSKNSLNQEERVFYFDDHPSYFSEKYLNYALQLFTTAIIDREYIHVTNETLRALRCKYIKTSLELYNSSNLSEENKKTLKDKNHQLEQLLSLIRSRGLLTLEEVHDSLNCRKILNMPYGPPSAPHYLQVALISKILKFASLAKDQVHLVNFTDNKQATQTPDNYKKMVSEIADELLKDAEWLSIFGIDPIKTEEIKEFLLDEKKTLPAYIALPVYPRKAKDLTAADHLLLAQRLLGGGWLKNCLSKNVYEHHGIDYASQLKISIPFIANNKPATGSQFSDQFILIINTLIAYLVNGLSDEQTKEFILYLKDQSAKEFITKKEEEENFSYADTFHYRKFKQLTSEGQIETELLFLDENNLQVRNKIRETLKNLSATSVELLFDFVSKKILYQVPLYEYQVSSNGQNTASMGKSVNGYSGSLDNKMIAPVLDDQGRTVSVIPEIGTNGQTTDLLVRKFNEVWVIPPDTHAIFDHVLAKLPLEQLKKVRALIDIGCHFCGKSNYEAATLINNFLIDLDSRFETNPLKEVRVILFFDETSGNLCFIRKGHPKAIKFLKGTIENEILAKTSCGPSQRFTFYGNGEITGQNILQAENATAIYTAAEGTLIHQLIQGTRRMRGLNLSQSLIGVIQSTALPIMADTIKDHTLLQISTGLINEKDFMKKLILFTHLNEARAIYKDNLTLCLSKLENIIEQFLLDAIYNKKLSQALVFKECGDIFVKQTAIDLVKEYGFKKKTISTEKFLIRVSAQLLKKLKPLNLSVEELAKLDSTLKQIIQTALPTIVPSMEISTLAKELNINGNQEGTMIQETVEEQVNTQENLAEIDLEMEYTEGGNSPAVEEPLTKEMLIDSQYGLVSDPPIIDVEEELSVDENEQEMAQGILRNLENIPFDEYPYLPSFPLHFQFSNKQDWSLLAHALKVFLQKNSPVKGEHKEIIEKVIAFFDIPLPAGTYKIFSLQALLENKELVESNLFDSSITMTNNFLTTESNTLNLVDSLRKIPKHILLIQDDDNTWKTVLCSLQEAQSISLIFQESAFALPNNRKMWLLRLSGDLAWKGPSTYNKKELFSNLKVRSLWVQNLFFSGNLHLLQKKEWLNELKKWLNSQSPETRIEMKTFFEKSILRNQLTVEYLSGPLRKLLSSNTL